MIRTCILCEATSAGTAVRFAPRSPICDWCAGELARRGEQVCVGCNKAFPLALATKSDPRRCPACRKAKRHARYEQNRERENAQARAWRAAHPGADAQRQRERYRTDPTYAEAKRAYHREYYARRREMWRAWRKRNYPRYRATILACKRRWYAANRQRAMHYNRAYYARRKLAILRGMR